MSEFDHRPPPPDADPVPSRSAGTRRRQIGGALTATVVVLAVAVFALTTRSSPSDAAAVASSTTRNGASGQQNGPDANAGRKGVAGTVTAIDGTTLAIDARPEHHPGRGSNGNGAATHPGTDESRNGTGAPTGYTVTTTDATKVVELTDGTVDDLAEGDTIMVAGTSSDGAVAAKRIVQTEGAFSPEGRRGPGGPPEGHPGPAGNGADHASPQRGHRGLQERLTVGTVTSIDGSTVTIRDHSGDPVKVTTTSDTFVQVTRKVDFSSIEVGDTVRTIGKVSGTKVAATAVVVGDEGVFGPGGRRGCAGSEDPHSTED